MEDWFWLLIKTLLKTFLLFLILVVMIVVFIKDNYSSKRIEICNQMIEGDVKTFCLAINGDKQKCQQLKTSSLVDNCMKYE